MGEAIAVITGVVCVLALFGSGAAALFLVLRDKGRTAVLEKELANTKLELGRVAARVAAMELRGVAVAVPVPVAPASAEPEAAAPVVVDSPVVVAAPSDAAPSDAAPSDTATEWSALSGAAPRGETPAAPSDAVAAPTAVEAPAPVRAVVAPSPPSAPAIDWEQWLGVRGAALLGGIVLSIAALYLFKLAIDNEWISPAMRVVLGAMVGLSLLLSTEWLHERFESLSKALGGAGIVVLYLSFWAAHARYWLLGEHGVYVAFALMALTTAAGVFLAIRRDALAIAVMGLVGGFITPLALSTGSDNPIGLFGYLMLLDAGFLYVSSRRRWTSLRAVALVGTLALQFLYISNRMGDDKLPVVLVFLAAFSALFVFANQKAADDSGRSSFLSNAASILMPIAFATYFASSARFGPTVYPVGVLLAFQLLAAAWYAVRDAGAADRLLYGASAGSAAVLLLAAISRGDEAAFAHSLAVTAVALPAVLFGLSEYVAHARETVPVLFRSAAGLSVAMAAVVSVAMMDAPADSLPWWAGAITALLLLGARAQIFGVPAAFFHAALVPAAVLFVGFPIAHSADPALPTALTITALEAAALVALHLAALVTRESHVVRLHLERGTAVLAAVLTFGAVLAPSFYDDPFLEVLGGTAFLGTLAALAATRAASGAGLLASVVATGLAHSAHALWRSHHGDLSGEVWSAFSVSLGTAVFFVLWPFLVAPRVRESKAAWASSAVAPAMFFLGLYRLYRIEASETVGLLPVGLGVLAFASLAAVRRFGPAGDAVRKSGMAWFGAVALGFAAVAIPLQLEKQWITIGWALEGAAVIVLWKRIDHAGLKWFGMALLTAVTVRLVMNPYVLEYGGKGTMPIVNWLLYTYWVPIGSVLTAQTILSRSAERGDNARMRPWASNDRLATMLGAYAVLLVFVWLNLAIADFFSTGREITLSFDRQPAKDLTTSIAWLLYAIAILVVGMLKVSKGLRWTSLVLMMITIVKVFFWDLSALKGIYFVFSLTGLAVSLLFVSVFYSRFVFRKTEPAASPPETPSP